MPESGIDSYSLMRELVSREGSNTISGTTQMAMDIPNSDKLKRMASQHPLLLAAAESYGSNLTKSL